MTALVSEIIENSIAHELEIEKGDVILSINGEIMSDMIDYNYMCKSEFITLEIQKSKDNSVEIIEIEKDFDEDLGIVFESAVFDRVKPCLNKCIFCFVDQQPKGLRDTLYVKDDDYRLSFLQGTYITLTNLSEKDKERISGMHLGPFYISVHTTNPELRIKMLKNPNAGKIMEQLQWFRKNKIPFHAQIVLCPGYNDGEELERTLKDLTSLKSNLLSVAIVPVGITKFRKEKLKKVDRNCALETIEIASKYKKVYCSDEIFLTAGIEIPPKKYYGKFEQLDDGVGAIRFLLENFKQYKLPKSLKKPLRIAFATSVAGSSAFQKISDQLNKIKNLKVTIHPVKSTYWGENITVAGLITSDDLINTVKDIVADYIVIPSIMLKPYSETFLDGNTLDYVREKTGKNFIINSKKYELDEVIKIIRMA